MLSTVDPPEGRIVRAWEKMSITVKKRAFLSIL